MPTIKFRGLLAEDAIWATEISNDAEAAKYLLSIHPQTEHEIKEAVKKQLEDAKEKCLIAELDGEPAGSVIVSPSDGRSRHIAWIGISVRRKHWGRGVGSALMKEAIKLGKDLGCRKLVLGVIEGNERALRLYKKSGFKVEGSESEHTYIDGSWRENYMMGLELAPCKPRKTTQPTLHSKRNESVSSKKHDARTVVRHLMDRDLDELHRLQNCQESTKSSKRVPPTTKEKTKEWYEGLKGSEGKYCLACFKNTRLLGYLRFTAQPQPFPNLLFEETIVDCNQKPQETANALVSAIKSFRERYGYHKIFAYVPQTSSSIVNALENHSFNNTGVMKNYYFFDEHYVDMMIYSCP